MNLVTSLIWGTRQPTHVWPWTTMFNRTWGRPLFDYYEVRGRAWRAQKNKNAGNGRVMTNADWNETASALAKRSNDLTISLPVPNKIPPHLKDQKGNLKRCGPRSTNRLQGKSHFVTLWLQCHFSQHYGNIATDQEYTSPSKSTTVDKTHEVFEKYVISNSMIWLNIQPLHLIMLQYFFRIAPYL